VTARNRLVLLGSAEGIALDRRVAIQAVVETRIAVQPFVLVVILLMAIHAPTALLKDNDRKTSHR
jgi:hypothetical protein